MTDQPQNLAQAIAHGLNAHHDHMREHHAEHRKNERLDFLEHLEGEGVEAIQQILGAHVNDMRLDPSTRALLERITNPTHQVELGAIAGILISIGYIVAQALMAGPASSLAMSSMRKDGSFALDPMALADAAWRDRIDDLHAFDRAQDSGVSGDKFGDMGRMVQQTLPPSQWMELWRLGRIGDDDMRRMLRRNGLDDESIESYLRLRQVPMDIGIAVSAVTQNQITMEQFRDILAWHGTDPAWAQVIYESAGATMPPDMAMRLYREGGFTLKEFEDALTESNLKNKYVPFMKKLRYRYPPMEQTLRMLRNKTIEAPEALDYLDKLGFRPEDAKRLVDNVLKGGGAAQKNLTPSVIERLYEVGRFTRGEAQQHLTALGYDATEADLLLFLADESKAHAAMERAATSIGTRYVSWKIDRTEAVTLLDRINYPSTHRDELLEVWDARREAQTAHLTEAFLHKAWKVGAVDLSDVRRRLLAMGYDETDTDIIMRTDFNEAPAKPKTRDLTRADETKRYNEGIIDLPTFKARLMNMGYDNIEADQIIELNDRKQAAAAEKALATNGA